MDASSESLFIRISRRFGKYTIVGVGTFIFDLTLLAILSNTTEIYYPILVAVSFEIAVSINFAISYTWVFKGTKRRPLSGYVYFITIALVGIILTTGLVTLLVEFLALQLLVARVLVAGLVGIFNFFINSIFNFKMM